MLSDYVLSGKHMGKRIGLDSQRMVLFIKDGGDKILIDDDNVRDYTLLNDTKRKGVKTYSVVWNDGSKSVVVIGAAYVNFFVSGCETGGRKLSGKEAIKAKRADSLFFIIIILGALTLFLFLFLIPLIRINDKTKNHDNISKSTSSDVLANSTKPYKWVKQNHGEELNDLPIGEVYINVFEDQVGQVDSEGLYHITGTIFNNHGSSLRDIKIFFNLVVDGEKVDICTAGIAGYLQDQATASYDAVCLSWPEGASYRISDVSAK